MTHRMIVNIYFNNKRKMMTDSVHKDNVVSFENVASYYFCSSFYSYKKYFLISLIIVIRKLIFTFPFSSVSFL